MQPRGAGAAGARVLYMGNYVDEEIVEARGLPSRNVAGSNRMRRLATALSAAKQRLIVVSAATAMRIRWTGRLFHGQAVRRAGNVPVAYCATVGLPLVGTLLEPLFLITTTCSLMRARSVSAVIIYNFSPSLVLIALLARHWWRVPIVHNIEDVSVARMSDWQSSTEVRPVQQIVFAFCMRIIARLSSKFVIPTRQFEWVIPPGRPCQVVSGCISVETQDLAERSPDETGIMRVLYAGKVEFEHGIDVFCAAIRLLNESPGLAEKIQFEISGTGSKSDWLQDQLSEMNAANVTRHGFVSDAEYAEILQRADACVALQDPHGRYGTNKTPSKVYEFLGQGKVVIATRVGDLDRLPDDVIVICDPASPETLRDAIADLAADGARRFRRARSAWTYARENFDDSVVGPKLREFISATAD